MKKINILLAGLLFYLSGCNLDLEPETNFTDAAFWKSETDIRAACNYMYDQLPGFSHDQRSDELVPATPNTISAGSRSVPTTSEDDWEKPYMRIFTANNILEKAPPCRCR